MSDSQQTSRHHKPSSDLKRNGSGRHHSDPDYPSTLPATPTATRSKSESGQSTSSTPIRPGSSLAARAANSTPRVRSRPTGLPLSSPLGRSASMRVSKKEKRWSMRLEEPRSPVSTYTDDYQSPEALSLHSLNLETTTNQLESEPVLTGITTYRASFRWKARQAEAKGQLKSPGNDQDTPAKESADQSTNHSASAKADAPASSTRTLSRNSHVYENNSHSCDHSVLQPPTSRHSASFFRRNASSGVLKNSTDGPSVSSTDRNSCGSSARERVSVQGVSNKAVPVTTPANGSPASVNGKGLQSSRTPQTQKLANGVGGGNVTSEVQTPRRNVRAHQLQSSHGGSPFAYGSDSGTWV